MHSHCLRCHRALKNPASRSAGYGPICLAKIRAEEERYDDHDQYDLPFAGDIVCYREPSAEGRGGRLHFNIPPIVVDHGGGWEWGYGGSGPAEFALNILHCFFRPEPGLPTVKTHGEQTVREDVYLLHQDFKWQFISTLPEEGGTISGQTIRDWFKANRVTQLSFAA